MAKRIKRATASFSLFISIILLVATGGAVDGTGTLSQIIILGSSAIAFMAFAGWLSNS